MSCTIYWWFKLGTIATSVCSCRLAAGFLSQLVCFLSWRKAKMENVCGQRFLFSLGPPVSFLSRCWVADLDTALLLFLHPTSIPSEPAPSTHQAWRVPVFVFSHHESPSCSQLRSKALWYEIMKLGEVMWSSVRPLRDEMWYCSMSGSKTGISCSLAPSRTQEEDAANLLE